jgi:hypothetical protein
MSEPAHNVELMRSLGRLVRGLSALFWGLPLMLVLCVQTARLEWLRELTVFPPLFGTGLLFYGLWQMSYFQKQERPWIHALDRAKLIALINCGLSPFLYWWKRMPENFFFTFIVGMLALSTLLLLFNLNLVLQRLGTMLPDETLRQETQQFTGLNRRLLVTLILFLAICFLVIRIPDIAERLDLLQGWGERITLGILVLLVLLPLAMTMALIWKTKETILGSVFSGKN